MSSLGKHILVEYSGCSPEIMNSASVVEDAMVEAARTARATLINSTFHHFSPFGVSGVVVIQESHLAIHTWPEYGYAAVDIFTCGDEIDPWTACIYLNTAFEAASYNAIEVKRGTKQLLQRVDVNLASKRAEAQEEKPELKATRNVWFTDKDENQATSIRHSGRTLFREETEFQMVQVFDSYHYGKFLALDDMIMTTEKDHFQYHEMATHPAVFAHGSAKNVLIIGGGDGGVASELLKHRDIEKVTLVEIDEAVINASKQYFSFAQSAFSDPRLNVVIDDGAKYVKEIAAGTFDLLIVDGSEPVGPAEPLFSKEFYGHCLNALSDHGIVVAQGESPRFNEQAFVGLNHKLKDVFGDDNVHISLFFVPTYPSGMWSFQWGCKNASPDFARDVKEIEQFVIDGKLEYYNPGVHTGSFALPNFVKKLVKRA